MTGLVSSTNATMDCWILPFSPLAKHWNVKYFLGRGGRTRGCFTSTPLRVHCTHPLEARHTGLMSTIKLNPVFRLFLGFCKSRSAPSTLLAISESSERKGLSNDPPATAMCQIFWGVSIKYIEAGSGTSEMVHSKNRKQMNRKLSNSTNCIQLHQQGINMKKKLHGKIFKRIYQRR